MIEDIFDRQPIFVIGCFLCYKFSIHKKERR